MFTTSPQHVVGELLSPNDSCDYWPRVDPYAECDWVATKFLIRYMVLDSEGKVGDDVGMMP